MGKQGCCIITMGGNVRHLLQATSSHDCIRRWYGIPDDDNAVSAYYMPVRECDTFKPACYRLFHREARNCHGDESAMLAATKANRPAWLDDDLWADAERTMRQAIAELLAADPIILNCPLRMKGCSETILPHVRVRDNTSLRYSAIVELIEGSWFSGGLDLRDTAIRALPENITVGGGGDYEDTPGYQDLQIEGTAITRLPESLHLGKWGHIMAGRSGLTWADVPEHLKDRVRGL